VGAQFREKIKQRPQLRIEIFVHWRADCDNDMTRLRNGTDIRRKKQGGADHFLQNRPGVMFDERQFTPADHIQGIRIGVVKDDSFAFSGKHQAQR
jgi:hypothetical protein